jgi:hypothetical protein
MFQSPPCPETECNQSARSMFIAGGKFQSPPCPETECNPYWDLSPLDAIYEVPIPTLPRDRVQRQLVNAGLWLEAVPIPTLPRDRVQPAVRPIATRTPCRFQSPPCPETECNGAYFQPFSVRASCRGRMAAPRRGCHRAVFLVNLARVLHLLREPSD